MRFLYLSCHDPDAAAQAEQESEYLLTGREYAE